MSIANVDFSKQQIIVAFHRDNARGDDILIGLLITQPGEVVTFEDLRVFFEEGDPTYFIAEPLPDTLQKEAFAAEALHQTVDSTLIQEMLAGLVDEYREQNFEKIHQRDVAYIVDPKILH